MNVIIYDRNMKIINDNKIKIDNIYMIKLYISTPNIEYINHLLDNISNDHSKFVQRIEFNHFITHLDLSKFINLQEIVKPDPYDKYSINVIKIR